jgi:hypothetical protein
MAASASRLVSSGFSSGPSVPEAFGARSAAGLPVGVSVAGGAFFFQNMVV